MTPDPILDRIATTVDPDYVYCFGRVAAVEVTIRRRGPSPGLLLRRAMLLMAMGNYESALEAAQEAVRLSPRVGEAHFQEGLAWLALAAVQCGAPAAPGVCLPPPRPLLTLVENAHAAFCSAALCARDEEADAVARRLGRLLAMDEPAMCAALRDP